MRAVLKNYKQSPRKVRLVADLIRGKSITDARAALMYVPKKSSPQILKLLNSAVANARQSGGNIDTLKVSNISVDKGLVMKRARPYGRGRSGTLRKTRSIIRIELAPIAAAAKKRTHSSKKLEARS